MQNPPPGASPGNYPPPAKASGGSGLDPKIAAALSYIWIVGLVFFFIEKEDRFVLSMATIKKTDDIEKLAKRIRGRLRRN